MASWHHGAMASWSHGIMDSWHHGLMASCQNHSMNIISRSIPDHPTSIMAAADCDEMELVVEETEEEFQKFQKELQEKIQKRLQEKHLMTELSQPDEGPEMEEEIFVEEVDSDCSTDVEDRELLPLVPPELSTRPWIIIGKTPGAKAKSKMRPPKSLEAALCGMFVKSQQKIWCMPKPKVRASKPLNNLSVKSKFKGPVVVPSRVFRPSTSNGFKGSETMMIG